MRITLRRLILPAAALLAALAGYGLAWLLRDPAPVPPAAGVAAVDFRLPDLDGRERSLGEWRGRLVLLNFWATWCPPCREEIPLFIRVQDQYAQSGLQIVGIAVDDPEAVLAYSESMGMNYPVLIGDDRAFSLMEQYGNNLGALPYSILISPQGEVLASKRGAYGERELENLMETALAAAGPPGSANGN